MRRQPESKSSGRRIVARRREGQAIDLRLAGAGLAAIAETLELAGPSSAAACIERGMTRLGRVEAADELRQIELARCDRLTQGVWPRAIDGDEAAINTVLRIMQRRARLAGLDQLPLQRIEQVNADGRIGVVLDGDFYKTAARLHELGKVDASDSWYDDPTEATLHRPPNGNSE